MRRCMMCSRQIVCVSESYSGIAPVVALRYLFERRLGSSIGIEQAVGFLICVGELCVAEAGKCGKISYCLKKRAVTTDQFLGSVAARISPDAVVFRRARCRRIR